MSTALVPIEQQQQEQSRTLPELIAAINAESDLAVQAMFSAVEHATRAGQALLEAKEQVPHGEWITWMRRELPQRDPSMLNRYMRLARYAEHVRAGEPPNIEAALQLVTAAVGGTPTKLNDLVVAEIIRLKAEGKTRREIAVAAGVGLTTVRLYTDPKYRRRYGMATKRRRKRAQKSLEMAERAAAAKRAGGAISEAYSCVRRALDQLGAVQCGDQEARRERDTAMHRLYAAEEAIGRVLRNT